MLFRDGDILKDMCKKVLTELGLHIEEGKIGREDLVFIYNECDYLIEVKGSKSSASKGNIRQLNSHIAEYENEKEKKVKGILLINPWRENPIEERNIKDKQNFPDEIMTLVNLSNITLMNTQQLFVAYCDNLEGKFNLNEFMKKIDDSNGIMEGYNDIQKYKITK